MKKTHKFTPVFAVLRISSPNTQQTFVVSKVGYSVFQGDGGDERNTHCYTVFRYLALWGVILLL